jgi:ABC-type uncharacterized transport system substrate-binding protein
LLANFLPDEFISLLGGAVVAWPLAARAQQPGKIARVGVLMGYAKGDPEAEGWVRGLIQGLHERRWVEGSNIRIDYRWPSENAGNMSFYAAELVDLKPDVIVAAATPALAAIAQETPSIPIVFVNGCRSGWARLRSQFRSSRWKHYGVYLFRVFDGRQMGRDYP